MALDLPPHCPAAVANDLEIFVERLPDNGMSLKAIHVSDHGRAYIEVNEKPHMVGFDGSGKANIILVRGQIELTAENLKDC